MGKVLLGKAHRLWLVSDLDGPMVDHDDGTHDKLRAFNRLWLAEFAADSVLVFSTGRSPELFHELAGEVPLLTPDILVCSVGTEILINGQPDEEWEAYLNQGWDRPRAAEIAAQLPELVMQRDSEQRSHKISYKLSVPDPERVLGTLRSALAAAGLDTVVIFSGGVDVDILPSRASKGKALSFLLKQLEEKAGSLPAAGVMVCGDSGNDIELFVVPGKPGASSCVHGCMVANAHPELREWCEANMHDRIFRATRNGPGGIVEALHHFSFPNPSKADTVHRRQALVGNLAWYEDWCNASIPKDDAACMEQMQLMDDSFEYVHPSGNIMTKQAFVEWFSTEGYGHTASAATATASPSSGDAAATGSGSSRYCMWLDRYSERQLAPGVWLARYMELHQPFAAGKHTREQRNGRWASVVLNQLADGTCRISYIHESLVPQAKARA
ncbi:hypothetical protein CHLNCDRAFT_53400 [Chlorella variabilis]|uniref:Sucrose-phosphatase n=1 Tax=Chlorella variabilis TaxID=554065 RepID=E1ZJQ0_CHLVA|nr:hypothetical protein CHLNCDRAFT_53400 [Chlorella variabilis]EFN54028.1 hypothetical protein CHLNCDRAFT_53400 [Chlorella variabilis]|eukprot:XP_005846130.1 hypothetical protein CHLNCDRAFT_53400 [Chlorella variabilis]